MEMLKFEHIKFLYLLLALLPLTSLFIWYVWWRKNAFTRLGDLALIQKLSPDRPRIKFVFKYILLFLAFASLVIAIANPQIGTRYEKVKRTGVDVMIALDVSKSMLAEDIKPNRLDRSKEFISRFIERLQSDRIGLIVFAGKAYLQMPITIDYSAAKLFLRNINTDMVPTQGTAIAEAIQLSMNAFNAEDKKHKVLVIITDGENHEGNVLEMAEQATEQGIVIYTIGVGSPKGAPIPSYRNGIQADFKRDNAGNIVLSKLNETALQQLSVKGDGKYFRLSTGTQEIDGIINEISGMEKKDFEESIFTDYEDQFQYFILLSIVLLLIEFFISDRKSLWWKNINELFKPKKA
jgi:Ca-activated chloride channel family protein